VFAVLPGATGSLSGLTVARGGEASGGGIANAGTLLLGGLGLVSNYATQQGGAVYNAGRLELTDSVLYGNACGGDGGAAYNAPGATLAVRRSTLYGNGAAGGGGGLYNAGAAALAACTVGADSAAAGGGLANVLGSLAVSASLVYGCGAAAGGGVYNLDGSLALSNSTLAQNSAYGDGGGLWTGGAAPGAVALTNVTAAENRAALLGRAGRGGGLFVSAGLPALFNTLVAGNFAGAFQAARDDVSGALSGGSAYDLIGDGTGMTGLADGVNHNQVGAAASPIEAGLGPLQDNGGPTLTYAVLAGSPARGSGSTAYATDADQRGLARVVDGRIDIGAYQTQDYGG
jgi:hypothetical protein